MAADTYLAPSYNDPALFNRGSIVVRSARVLLTSLVGAAGSTVAAGLLELNDVFKIFKLPPDVKILWARIDSEDLDSATSLVSDLTVYNGTTTKYLFKDSTVGRTAALGAIDSRDSTNATGVPAGLQFKFSTDSAIGYVVPDDNYWVQWKITTAPAGASVAAPSVEFEIAYTCQLESGDAAFRT